MTPGAVRAARISDGSGPGLALTGRELRLSPSPRVEAILRPHDQASYTGFWNADEGHFNRGIEPACRPDDRIDASTDLVWVFGLLDAEEEKARFHRDAVIDRLQLSDYYQGISRFEDDGFYFWEMYSPGGVFE